MVKKQTACGMLVVLDGIKGTIHQLNGMNINTPSLAIKRILDIQILRNGVFAPDW